MSIAESQEFEVVREETGTPYSRQYEATHPDYPGPILVEVLEGSPKAPADLAAFEREVVTLSLLGHPGLLEAADMGALPDGTPVVVSSLLPGMGLARWLHERRPLSTREALSLIGDLAGALTAIHERGMSHGAVCPENVYVVTDERGGPTRARLHGFRQRRLCQGAVDDAAARDVRELATLAEQMLTPADLRTTGVGRSFGTTAAVSAVVEQAVAESGEGFASPQALLNALSSAVASEGGTRLPTIKNAREIRPPADALPRPRVAPDRAARPARVPLAADEVAQPRRKVSSGLIPVETLLMPGAHRDMVMAPRRRSSLTLGLLAGSGVSLLAVFALMSPLSRSGLLTGSSDPAAAPPPVLGLPGPPPPAALPEPVAPVAIPDPVAALPAPAALPPRDPVAALPPPALPPRQDPIAPVVMHTQPIAAPALVTTSGSPAARAAEPARMPPPVLPVAATFKPPATAQPADAVAALNTAPRRPATTALRGVVWSDREHKLITVDEAGSPVLHAPDGPPPAPAPPAPSP